MPQGAKCSCSRGSSFIYIMFASFLQKHFLLVLLIIIWLRWWTWQRFNIFFFWFLVQWLCVTLPNVQPLKCSWQWRIETQDNVWTGDILLHRIHLTRLKTSKMEEWNPEPIWWLFNCQVDQKHTFKVSAGLKQNERSVDVTYCEHISKFKCCYGLRFSVMKDFKSEWTCL